MSELDSRLQRAGADLRAAYQTVSRPSVTQRSGWTAVASFLGGAAVIILAIGVPIILWGGSGANPGVEAGSPPPAPNLTVAAAETTSSTDAEPTASTANTSTTDPVPAACGTELPFTAILPDDFTGPIAGPSPQANSPVEPGQLVVHWTGRGGSVELRWPADSEHLEGVEWGQPPKPDRNDRSDNTSFVVNKPVVPSMNTPENLPDYNAFSVLPTDAMEEPCDASQLSLYGAKGTSGGFGFSDPRATDELALGIIPDLPRDSQRGTIADSLTVDTVPQVVACNPGEAVIQDVPENETSTLENGDVFASPVEALVAFLGTPAAEHWPKTGYFELVEPDGSITYGSPYVDDLLVEPTPGNGLVIAVSVTQVADGWTVDSWTTTGC